METEEFINISNNLLSLSTENFDEVEKEITNSPLLDSEMGLYVFTGFFNQTHRVRYQLLDLLAQLFVKISKDPSNPRHAKLPEILKLSTFQSIDPTEFRTRIRTLYFIRKCFTLGLYEKETFIKDILQYFEDHQQRTELHILDAIFFAPEIVEVDPSYFQTHKSDMKGIEYFFENYNELSADNWKLYYEILENEGPKDSVRNIIKRDDVDALTNITLSQPNFSYKMTLPIFLFEPNSMLQRGTNLLQAAAFFGSIKCMKYLILVGVSPTAKDKESYLLSEYCVTGGSIDAVRIAQQCGADFHGAAQLAVEYFRFDILEWIYREFSEQTWRKDMYGRSRVHNAAISGNIQILDEINNDNDPLEGIDLVWDGSTPLSLAIKNDSIAAIKYILDHSKKSVEYLTDGLSIFQNAIMYSHDEVCLFLLEMLPEWNHLDGRVLPIDDLSWIIFQDRYELLLPFAKAMKITPEQAQHHFPFVKVAVEYKSVKCQQVMKEHPEIFGECDFEAVYRYYREQEEYEFEEEEEEEDEFEEEEEANDEDTP